MLAQVRCVAYHVSRLAYDFDDVKGQRVAGVSVSCWVGIVLPDGTMGGCEPLKVRDEPGSEELVRHFESFRGKPVLATVEMGARARGASASMTYRLVAVEGVGAAAPKV